MIKFFFLLLLIPSMLFAQTKKTPLVKGAHGANISKTGNKVKTIKAPDGYLINGNIAGFPNGTSVSLINANNGTVESTATVSGGKFSLSGKLMNPDFKVIAFDSKAPYITLFLDNSLVTVTGKKDELEKAVVKGSASNDEYAHFSALVKPYEKVFSGEVSLDSLEAVKLSTELTKFIQENPQSHISPLAIYRQYQVAKDNNVMERLFSGLTNSAKSSSIGSFVAKQIADNKKNPVGQPLADFTQTDTAGQIVALSSLKGKYVLVDFWASWCGPCRQENPNVVNMFNKFKDKNFTVLGVSLDKTKKAWVDAINMDALTWTHVSDLQGWNNAVAQKFEIFSIPQNFLLDPKGNVIAKNLRGPALESTLTNLLK